MSVVRQGDGWLIRGNNRLAPPLDVVTRTAEIAYDAEWRPTRMFIDGTSQRTGGFDQDTFANGQASSEISVAGTPSTKVDQVASRHHRSPQCVLRLLRGARPPARREAGWNDIPRLHRPAGRDSHTARGRVSGAHRNREAGDRCHAVCADQSRIPAATFHSASGQTPTARCCE